MSSTDCTLEQHWLSFWLESWQWADEGWQRRYAPASPSSVYAARVLYRGWHAFYALSTDIPPLSQGWSSLLAAPPSRLRRAARLIGWMLHLSVGATPCREAKPDLAAQRQAMQYLQAKPLPIQRLSVSQPLSAEQTGLLAMAQQLEQVCPSAQTRIGMMLPPELGLEALPALCLRPQAEAVLLRFWQAALRWAARQESQHELCSA